MEFIIESSVTLCIILGLIWAGGLVGIWSCLAMSKRCEVEDE